MGQVEVGSKAERHGLLSVEEVAAYIGTVPPRWVRRQVADRAIPYTKLRNRVLFDPAAIDRWLAERAVAAEE